MAKSITREDVRRIESEYAKWKEILNVGVGVLSFTLGIACLGTPCPGLWATVSLAFVLVLFLHFRRYFPKTIRHLRKQELEAIDALTLQGIENKYFSGAALFAGFGGYWFGFLFLCLVAVGGWMMLDCSIAIRP